MLNETLTGTKKLEHTPNLTTLNLFSFPVKKQQCTTLVPWGNHPLEGEPNFKEKFNNYSNESENSILSATSSVYRTVKINSSR
jgi:hypothetical protein